MRVADDGLTRTAPRLVRGGAAGVSTGLLAVFAHASAGGALPAWPAVAGPVLAIAACATGLARVRLRPAGVLALIGIGQLAVHAVLSLAADHADHAGHAGHGASATLMTAAHVAATAIVFVGLAGAEHALFALSDALTARLPTCPRPPVASGPMWIPHPPDPPRRAVLDVLCRRVHGRRGPPRSTTVLGSVPRHA